MKKYILTLALILLAVPVMAEPAIVTETTTTVVTFVMYDGGTIVADPTVTGVLYRKGNSTTATAMTTPTTGDVTNGEGEQYLIADEGTTITEGLVEENIEFIITASDADTAFVRAKIVDAQATIADLVAGFFTADPGDHDAADNFADLILRVIKTGKLYTVSSENDPTANVEYTEE